MQQSSTPAFGKRNASLPPRRPAPAAVDHAAFFAEARREIDARDDRPLTVPRSFRAALLAGLVVGACLVGLDITATPSVAPALQPLLDRSGLVFDGAQALPYMIMLSLFSGARIAATTLLISHRLLRWAGQSSHLAYACGGAALTAAYAGIVLAITHHPPQHGWAIDLAAGAGSGFFYRLFAGARRV